MRLLIFTLLVMQMVLRSSDNFSYPKTRTDDVTDDYFGTKVTDSYRWLEDDHSAETKAWVDAENQVTDDFLKKIPEREKIRERLKQLWNYERFSTPTPRGGRYFFTRNSGLQNQAVLYVTDGLDQPGRVLLDPNTLSKEGTTSLSEIEPSEDGRRIVYGVSRAGSDWQEFRVRDVESGEDLKDLVKWVKFSGASWAKDGSGFYYSRFDVPKSKDTLKGKNEFQKLYFHKLGEDQEKDVLVYERKDHADWGFYGRVTEDGLYLIITSTQGTDPKNRIFYKDLSQAAGGVVALLDDFDADYSFLGNEGSVFFFHTNLDAPRYRVIAVDVAEPARAKWREIIPQSEHKLESVRNVGGQWICEYLQDARSLVKCFTMAGRLVREVELPGIGSVAGFEGRRADAFTFYSFTSFTVPGAVYRYEVATGESQIWRESKVDFKGADYETRQVFFKSKDGTRVPMFITHKRGLKRDGSAAALLYGYGGFNVPLTPGFSVGRAVWLEMGGVYAVANLRGGGEYGADWHEAGTKLRKQNVFDDFIAAAEFLVAERYTASSRLAIQGGSNGGLLVGACMVQRPGFFAAALPAVGVMDMLRFHQFTIGWAWKSDYGSSEKEEEFRALLAYSPYHNLKPGVRYPATLVTTADHDDRVVPAHSFKFAARLQHCQQEGGPPVFIRIERSAGHGAGTALNKMIEKTADEWAFLTKVLGMK